MTKKYIVWHKLKNGIYQRNNYSDELMVTLSLFLDDGLETKRYIDFLKNDNRKEAFFNISKMEKQNGKVTIFINGDIFPNMPPFTTTIENMIIILKEYSRLENLGVDRIEITLDDNVLTITSE